MRNVEELCNHKILFPKICDVKVWKRSIVCGLEGISDELSIGLFNWRKEYSLSGDLIARLQRYFPDRWADLFALSMVRLMDPVPLNSVKDRWEKLCASRDIHAHLSSNTLTDILRDAGFVYGSSIISPLDYSISRYPTDVIRNLYCFLGDAIISRGGTVEVIIPVEKFCLQGNISPSSLILNKASGYGILQKCPVSLHAVDMDILLIIYEVTGWVHHCYWNERNCLSHSLRRYYDPSDCVKDVCCLSQGCFHPGANALLFHIVRIMLSVTIIRRSCNKRISAVLAKRLIRYMFFQNDKNLMDLGRNREPIACLIAGKNEKQIDEIMLEKIRSLYGYDPIIVNFLAYLKNTGKRYSCIFRVQWWRRHQTKQNSISLYSHGYSRKYWKHPIGPNCSMNFLFSYPVCNNGYPMRRLVGVNLCLIDSDGMFHPYFMISVTRCMLEKGIRTRVKTSLRKTADIFHTIGRIIISHETVRKTIPWFLYQ